MSKSYTGIAFPFHIGVKGGIALSTTTVEEAQHIKESIQQIVRTRAMERVMEYHIKCEVSTELFDSNNESTRALIAYECEQAIKECDERVEVLSVDIYGEDHIVYATITFRVKKYERTYSVNTKVGEF